MISDFTLAKEALAEFKKPQGNFIKDTGLKNLIPERLIAVGDETNLKLAQVGITPALAIFDYKIKRGEISKEVQEKLGEPDLRVKNPAGVISLGAWNAIKQALSTQSSRILVDGEEDLLAIATYFLAPSGFKILYGQPNKGLICWEVSDKKKQEYAELLIATSAREFISKLKGKTVVLHHDDPDGCTSAVLMLKKVKAVPIVTNDVTIHANLRREIEKENAKNLIIVDLGGEARSDIVEMSQKMNVMVVDHHQVWGDAPFGNALLLNPHLFEVPDTHIAPASYLCYKITQDNDWIAAIGVIGDKGQPQCADFLKKTKSHYKVDFDELTELASAADVVGESDSLVQILLKANGPGDLLKSKELVEYGKTVASELNLLLAAHKKEAKLLAGGKLLVYEMKSELEMRGAVANQLQTHYPDKVIIIAEAEDDEFSMSLRTMRDDFDLVPAIKASIAGLKSAQGGGHAHASGAKVLLKDKETFLQRFAEQIK
ncbi:MAG: DUF359 domain-containing protein [archaeon]